MPVLSRTNRLLIAVVFIISGISQAGAERPLAVLRGSEFKGGAKDILNGPVMGHRRLNIIYAQETGDAGTIFIEFNVNAIPNKPLFLHMEALGDDYNTNCPMAIDLNSTELYSGNNEFPSDAWSWKRYPIPAGTLRMEKNELRIRNLSPNGPIGAPPWIMIAGCAIGGETVETNLKPTIEEDFRVELPKEKRPIPEPLPADGNDRQFKIRGTKGWAWTPEQYLAEIPYLADFKMNFLMNCYLSVGFECDKEPGGGWLRPKHNVWWKPLPDAEREAYERVVRSCQEHGIDFCFAMNPNLASSQILDYNSDKDFEALWQHYAWMQRLGVKWFCVSLDDISQGIDAGGQAKTVNRLFNKLREADPECQFVFCPTYYAGLGNDDAAKAYLETLAKELYPDVYVFWTGPEVVSRTVSSAEAQTYKSHVRHRLILWDNYPVNDAHPTMHLGPITGRDPHLFEEIDGFMSNPHWRENEINRIPLLTMADYAYNPLQYDPARSIGQTILHLAETAEQREVLVDLVERYPSPLITQRSLGFRPVLSQFTSFLDQPHQNYLARMVLRDMETLRNRFAAAFPGRFAGTLATVDDDITVMKTLYRSTYDE